MKVEALSPANSFVQYEELAKLMQTLSGQKIPSSIADTSVDELRKLFRDLKPVENKYFMLLFLPHAEKVPLLNKLMPRQLLWGVSLFPKELLKRYLLGLAKLTLIKLFLKNIRLKRFLNYFPKHVLLFLLFNRQVKPNQILRGLNDFVPEGQLQRMVTLLTGKPAHGKSKAECLNTIGGFDKRDIVKSMMAMDKEYILRVVERIAEIMPEIMERIPDYYMEKVTNALPKRGLMRLMEGLEPESHINLLSNLGNRDLAFVLTELDDKLFEEIMVVKQPQQLMAMAQTL